MVNLPENSSINIFKGVLILLVIIGHILIGPLNDNFIRFIIYSFHMPLFFFISGYLIKFDKLKMMSLKEFAEKYTKRLLKGWSVAWIIYTLLILNTQISIKSLIQYTIYPYYHLWFIPTLFSMFLLLFLLSKIASKKTIIIIGVLIGILCHTIKVSLNIKIPPYFDLSQIPFFLVGLSLQNYKGDIGIRNNWIIVLTVLTSFIIIFYAYDNPMVPFQKFWFLPLNFCLCFAVCGILKKEYTYSWKSRLYKRITPFTISMLVNLGKNTYSIYLWHVLPLLFYKYFLSNDYLAIYYIISFISLFIFLICYTQKNIKNENNRIYSC